MAKFRDSTLAPLPEDLRAEDLRTTQPPHHEEPTLAVHDRSIGDLIRLTKNLSTEQVESILKYQRAKHVRFGEAAIALGLATDEDVLFALSQQFHYPYAPDERRSFTDELIVASKPFSQQAEVFRAIRSQLNTRIFNVDGPRPALAVISPDSGDGKTFFAANLAASLAQLGGRTLLVDADLRGPRLHTIFGLKNASGLSSILSGRSDGNVIQQVRDMPSLFVLPVGAVPPNPLELLERPAFGLLMRELSSKFDYVVVDTPAAVYGADSCVVAARCGAALALARKGVSHLGSLQDLIATLADTPIKMAGVVVNEY